MEVAGFSWSAIALGLAVVVLANVALWFVFRWLMSASRSRRTVPQDQRPAAAEMAELRAEVDRLKAEIRAMQTVRPNVSPYTQALGLAQQGFLAPDVAARCGITRGEAELLIALFGKSKINGLE